MVEELEGDMSVKQSFCGFHLLVFFFFNFLFFNFLAMLCAACRISISHPRIEPMPPAWKHGVLTTGPLGKSLSLLFLMGDVIPCL